MLGERLKKLRIERKLTQEEAAKRLGFVRSTYSNYESGKREPDFATTKQMAEFFDVSVDYLTGKSEAKTPTTEEKVRDLVEFLTNKETTVNGQPIPQSLIDDILGYVRIHLAKDKQTGNRNE